MKPESLTTYVFSPHARNEMARRQIAESDVVKVLSDPEQVAQVREGRSVYQSRIPMGEPPITYLLRVFVEVDRYPPKVVTVYRTSKIQKYWRDEA